METRNTALNRKNSKAIYWASVSVIGIVLGVSLQFVKAWTEPAVAPPGSNVGAPLNTSAVAQIKSGPLQVNGFRNIGNSVFDGDVSIVGITKTSKIDLTAPPARSFYCGVWDGRAVSADGFAGFTYGLNGHLMEVWIGHNWSGDSYHCAARWDRVTNDWDCHLMGKRWLPNENGGNCSTSIWTFNTAN